MTDSELRPRRSIAYCRDLQVLILNGAQGPPPRDDARTRWAPGDLDPHAAYFMSAESVLRFGRVVAEIGLHLSNVGSAAPHLRQCVGDRSAQLSNRFVGEDRPRVCEPVDAHIEGGQRLFQSRNFELNDWVFSHLDFPEGIAKRADFLRQVSEICQHVL